MKEIPVLFQPDMVRAVLSDTAPKTQTRRTKALEYFSENDPDNWKCVRINGDTAYFIYKTSPIERAVKCPYGQAGDRIWGREAWRTVSEADPLPPRLMTPAYRLWYEADQPHQPGFGKQRPSMFMPRWASRITLEVISVRIERLQDISHEDAEAEGVTCNMSAKTFRDHYRDLWERINGAGSWDANPFLWVIEFRKITL